MSWITDSFRIAEVTARELIGSANSNRLAEKLEEYQTRASHAVTKLGTDVQQSTAGLTADGIVKIITDFSSV